MRNTILITAGVVLMLLTVSILVGAYLMLRPHAEETTQSVPTVDPFGSVTTGTPTTPTHTVSLVLTDGSTVAIPDFSKTEQPPAASELNGYQIAGGSVAAFQILYFPLDSGIMITLNAEPLGQTRADAERELQSALNLSQAELCKVNIQVSTSYSVNSTFAGENLGLSFCPNSVKLP